jgi:hypothetical protein
MLNNVKSSANQNINSNSPLMSYLDLIFSIAFAVFILGPPFLGYQFSPYPLMHIADVFDIFTPIILLPLYWLLFRWYKKDSASIKENLIFIVFAAFWVLGQGMHLSANSIDNLLGLKGIDSGDIFSLTYFYDETLGHYLWHIGVIGLSALIIYRRWRSQNANGKTVTWSNIVAGIIYGFVFFAMVNEGTTVPMGLPFAILIVAIILIRGRGLIKQQPLISMFLTGYSFALLLFAIWGIWHHGFPGFFEAGIMK